MNQYSYIYIVIYMYTYFIIYIYNIALYYHKFAVLSAAQWKSPHASERQACFRMRAFRDTGSR